MTKATAMRNPARIIGDNAQRIWFELKEIQVNLPLCTIGGCTRGRGGGRVCGESFTKILSPRPNPVCLGNFYYEICTQSKVDCVETYPGFHSTIVGVPSSFTPVIFKVPRLH